MSTAIENEERQMKKLISRYRNGIGHRECKDLTGHPDAMPSQRKRLEVLFMQADRQVHATAADKVDHLKHRTGSLGGDQDEKDNVKRFGFGAVDLRAAENPTGAFVLYPDYDRAVARIDALELEVKHWMTEAQSYKPAWDEMKAALAQKTRECEEKDAKFSEHTRAVGRFLSDMYATMIDPLDDCEDRKVSEMCELLLNAAVQNRQDLQDQIDRAGNLPANWKEDSSLETWFPLTAEELTRLRAQVEQLGRQVAEMRRPVTEEEFDEYFHLQFGSSRDVATINEINALLASRARTK